MSTSIGSPGIFQKQKRKMLNAYNIIFITCLISLLSFLKIDVFAQTPDLNIWIGGEFENETWYDTIFTMPDSNFEVKIWVQGENYTWIDVFHLALGANVNYFDQIVQPECIYHYPFTEWDVAEFCWSLTYPEFYNLSFVGFCRLGEQLNPWLHTLAPTHVLSFVVHAINNANLIDSTFCDALMEGQNSVWGGHYASDTMGIQDFLIDDHYACVNFAGYGYINGIVTNETAAPVEGVYVTLLSASFYDSTDIDGEYHLDSLMAGKYDIAFSHPAYMDTVITDIEVTSGDTTLLNVVMSSSGYPYLPGDVNMLYSPWPPAVQGGDVTYLVNSFRMIAANTPCYLDGFWASADINGDCYIDGGDLTALVNISRSILPGVIYCPDYEPLWHDVSELPAVAPPGWPNCESPPAGAKVISIGSTR